jgi:predicted deacylase
MTKKPSVPARRAALAAEFAAMSRLYADIDLAADGKACGFLRVPHSVHRSAYGWIPIPIVRIRNGDGPKVVLLAGNHGDEWEGQIALGNLARRIEPEHIRGRIVMLPSANFPAAMASTRTSPIDGGNLNRAFPGDPDRGVTQEIAHYIDSVLFPMSNLFADLHSGGSSLAYVPFASTNEGPDPAVNRRSLDALTAFGVEYSVVWKHADPRYSPGAAIARGLANIAGEFGGGGSVNRRMLANVEQGLWRLLEHMGIWDGPTTPPAKTRYMNIPGIDYHVHAPDHGLFEPATNLGDWVKAGDLCGVVHFVDDPIRPPVPCYFKRDGMVICQRHPARVERGDCVAHQAIDGV